MSTAVAGVLGVIAEFFVSIVLFDLGPGMDLQPIVLALACAFAATVVDAQARRAPGR